MLQNCSQIVARDKPKRGKPPAEPLDSRTARD